MSSYLSPIGKVPTDLDRCPSDRALWALAPFYDKCTEVGRSGAHTPLCPGFSGRSQSWQVDEDKGDRPSSQA